MNVYLGANEIDPQTLGSLNLSGIYKGSDTVWTPAPSTKRLGLYIETDGLPSSDGRWKDDSLEDISYVDMPVDYTGVFLTGTGGDFEFVPTDSSRNLDSSLTFIALPSPGQQGIVFKGIEYIPYGGTAFDVDLNQTLQAIPYAETGGLLQDGDKMVMVFETSSAPTFTVVNNPNSGRMNNAIESAVMNGEGLSSFTISCSENKILLGSDGYYYCAVLGTVSWWPQDARNCYVKMSISGETWDPVYTVEDYYIETGTPEDSSFCNYFYSGDSTYIPAIASYVGDPSIVDVQTLGEYIYNKLQ